MNREEPNLPLGVFSVQQQLGVAFGCIQKNSVQLLFWV